MIRNHTSSDIEMWVLQDLEEKRKEKAKVAYERRKQLTRFRTKAEKVADEKLGAELQILEPLKY